MIVPMKKVTLLVLKKYELEAVGKLKKLGVVHIEHGTLKDSKDRNASAADFNAMEKVVNALSLYKGVYNEEKAVAEFGSGRAFLPEPKQFWKKMRNSICTAKNCKEIFSLSICGALSAVTNSMN